MTIQDYIRKVVAYLTIEGDLYAPFITEQLSSDRKSICIRTMPSRATQFYQDGRVTNFQFQILTKSDSQVQALDAIETIANLLARKHVQIQSEPSFLEKDEQGFIYTASFLTNIERNY